MGNPAGRAGRPLRQGGLEKAPTVAAGRAEADRRAERCARRSTTWRAARSKPASSTPPTRRSWKDKVKVAFAVPTETPMTYPIAADRRQPQHRGRAQVRRIRARRRRRRRCSRNTASASPDGQRDGRRDMDHAGADAEGRRLGHRDQPGARRRRRLAAGAAPLHRPRVRRCGADAAVGAAADGAGLLPAGRDRQARLARRTGCTRPSAST